MNTYSRPLPRKALSSALVQPVQPSAVKLRPLTTQWAKWQMPSLVKSDDVPEAFEPPEEVIPAAPSPEEIEQAHQEALAKEIEQLKQKAYEEAYAHGLEVGSSAGFKQGYAQGQLEGFTQAQEVASVATAERLGLLDQMAAQARSEYEHLQHEIAQGILSLATQVAEHVLGHELKTSTESTLATIKRVLACHDNEGELLTFRLNPDDLPPIEQELNGLRALARLRLIPDASIQSGGVRVQTAHGDIDATVQMRWRAAIGSLGRSE